MRDGILKDSLVEWQISALKQVLSSIWEEKGKEMKVDDIMKRCLELRISV